MFVKEYVGEVKCVIFQKRSKNVALISILHNKGGAAFYIHRRCSFRAFSSAEGW